MEPIGLTGLLLAVSALVWMFVWEPLGWPGSIMWRAKRSLRRAHLRRLGETTDVLAREAEAAVRSERWERFEAAKALQPGRRFTDADLLACLEALYREIREDDKQRGRHGRDSNGFEFHDCGLAAIMEALAERRKAAP